MRASIAAPSLVAALAFAVAAPAQTAQPPSAGYPEPPAAAPAPPPPAAAPAAQPPAAQAAPPAAQAAPPPAQAAPPPAAQEPPPAQAYGQTTRAESQPAYGYEEPPPPPPPKQSGDIPSFAVRVDPLNALLAGRLGLELEVQLWKIITFETVPVFVVWQNPPSFNLAERDTNLHQESNGLGPLSGASLGLGFWLEGKPLRGYVLKAVFANYGYSYVSTDAATGREIDRANRVNRVLYGFFGSYSKIGAFTIGGGLELGAELNRERRCFTTTGVATTDCPKDDFLLKLDDFATTVGSLNGGVYPVYFGFRLSLGVAIDP